MGRRPKAKASISGDAKLTGDEFAATTPLADRPGAQTDPNHMPKTQHAMPDGVTVDEYPRKGRLSSMSFEINGRRQPAHGLQRGETVEAGYLRVRAAMSAKATGSASTAGLNLPSTSSCLASPISLSTRALTCPQLTRITGVSRDAHRCSSCGYGYGNSQRVRSAGCRCARLALCAVRFEPAPSGGDARAL